MATSKPTKPVTMKQWEKSPQDRKMDASGKYGKEGSAKDKAADKKMLAKVNAKRGKK